MISKRQEMMDKYSPASEEERTRLHREYYGLLVETLGEKALRGLIPRAHSGDISTKDWLVQMLAQDRHLNNVPLGLWDRSHCQVYRLYMEARSRMDITTIIGQGGWSQSDSVCVLKETARRWVAETPKTEEPPPEG